MDSLSTELLYAIGELLPRHSLAHLCRVNRRCSVDLQPLLFRRHGHPETWEDPSAVFWAVQTASRSNSLSQLLAMAVLDKVERFCRPGAEELDRSYSRHRHEGDNKDDDDDDDNDGNDNDSNSDAANNNNNNNDATRRRNGGCVSLLTDERAEDWARRFDEHASWSALQLAAYKGLDGMVAWLLAHGATVDAPMEGTPHSALVAAVVANRGSTALLLLAHGARPMVSLAPHRRYFRASARAGDAAVTTLAAALGHGKMAQRLLETGLVRDADASEMLYAYADHGHGSYAFVGELVGRGAEASPRMFGHVVTGCGSWRTAPLALLEHMSWSGRDAAAWTPTVLDGTVQQVVRRFHDKATRPERHDDHYDSSYYDDHVAVVQRVLRRLLAAPGVDVDLGGLALWCQPTRGRFDNALVRHLLPCFVEAGMDVRCVDAARRRRQVAAQKKALRAASDAIGMAASPPAWASPPPLRRDPPGDLLAAACRYDAAQCDRGAAAQVAVVRLLLQHGARITPAACDHALRHHPVGPSAYADVGRPGWCVRLCGALLAHCRGVPPDKHTADMQAFLALYREKTRSYMADHQAGDEALTAKPAT